LGAGGGSEDLGRRIHQSPGGARAELFSIFSLWLAIGFMCSENWSICSHYTALKLGSFRIFCTVYLGKVISSFNVFNIGEAGAEK